MAKPTSRKKKPKCDTTNRLVLLLHGNRQTGQILLGRLDRLERRLSKECHVEILAPDAPFVVQDDNKNGEEARHLLTWWERQDDEYQGLDETLRMLQQSTWNNDRVVGIIGFSQGARLTYLLSLLHEANPQECFCNLQFTIVVSGYHAPLPPSSFLHPEQEGTRIRVPTLHVWGLGDTLVTPDQSESLVSLYQQAETHVHPGKHFVPTKGPDLQVYMDFIVQAMAALNINGGTMSAGTSTKPVPQDGGGTVPSPSPISTEIPDEEGGMLQRDEVQALEAIFPDEIQVQSPLLEIDGEMIPEFPIRYRMYLRPEEDPQPGTTNWPKHPLTLQIQYPHNYPLEAIPQYQLLHENNNYEFSSKRVDRVMSILTETSTLELGMPSVLSGVYAVKEYLDSTPEQGEAENPIRKGANTASMAKASIDATTESTEKDSVGNSLIPPSDPAAVRQSNLEGLDISEGILKRQEYNVRGGTTQKSGSSATWSYVIGLVGKPSAGKSTFFNAATGFSRQRGDDESSEWGGASMAAHPFTTIDPNIGYCLIPAPPGVCPENVDGIDATSYGSTHGRSPDGRRFLPVLLKDVAGLVPGAYQGRGRGNQFLNDLTDATVLVHVLDASGTADAQGNKTATEDEETSELTNPIDDLAWIRNELVEWVYGNLAAKWDAVLRRGRVKLSGMFSGYGQREIVTQVILSALEKYLEEAYDREKALDQFSTWDQADVHRLVSTFLGVRFPMALALNKCDLPSSKEYVAEIKNSLPIHGAHVGTPMAACQEMMYVRSCLKKTDETPEGAPPLRVWECLTSAMMLRPPLFVFPVLDMATYAPLPSLNREAAENASLPSPGMISCISAVGGTVPSCWQTDGYVVPDKNKSSNQKLRDVLLMKPGSTVEDVFYALKKLGAIGGEFVRAEAAENIGDKPKPIPKLEVMERKYRIIKIMSNRRAAWQS
eukprot:Nitzschia sp. Nitz4//scaffold158_size52425//28445//31267//NITZ4_006859-RA/size52425-processed-gene-0.8-mRNA-1//1//CDS//3329537513//9037//frame0